MAPTASLAASRLATSRISEGIEQSEIRAMSMACDAKGGINLAQGICDTEIPSPVVEAGIKAIRDGHNAYTRLDGIATLRNAIAAKIEARGMPCDPQSNVVVTSGATGGMLAACLALLNPGDEVVLFEPFYGYHRNTLLALKMHPRSVVLNAPDWTFEPEALRDAVTSRTRAIIINTPGNPTGKVFTRRELEQIAAVAIEHNLFVFTDEIYEYFVYDGAEHVSLASLPGMAERTITITGLSKTFSITGWRIGYLTASSKWTPAIGYFHDLTYVCAPSPFQHGAATGLVELPASFYEGIARAHESKRDRLCSALWDAGLTSSKPRGAYYILANVSKIEGKDAKQRARTLLEKTGVAAVAGSAFYENGGDDHLRFCFAKRDDALDEACRRLRTLQ